MNNSETFQFQVYEKQQQQPQKKNLSTKLGKIGLRATHPASSQSAGFPNNVPFPYPNTLSLSILAWPVVSSTSLDLVTFYQP